jgi:carbamoyl-phosphate synthase large subunit
MKTILVSGASGIVGYGILKSLRSTSMPLRLIGTSIFDYSVAPKYCDTFVKAVPTSNSDYISWLIKVIREFKVDMIVPGIDADMYKWADNVELLEATGCKILINNLELISLCSDKWLFYERLKEENNPNLIPSSISKDIDEIIEKLGLPLILKPRHGFGSKGIVRVLTKESFYPYRDKIGADLMVQPLIGDDDNEYTVSAFCDGKGYFSSIITFRRKLSSDGFTEKAEVVEINDLEQVIGRLCRIFKPLGPTNFQFRQQNGVFLLLEINPRISSSTSIRTAFGFNECEMSIVFYLEGRLPVQPKVRKGRAIRYVEDYIVYE